MRWITFTLAFLIGWLFFGFHRVRFDEPPPQPPMATGASGEHIIGQGRADPHDARSYGPMKTWPCALPDVCVHARHRD